MQSLHILAINISRQYNYVIVASIRHNLWSNLILIDFSGKKAINTKWILKKGKVLFPSKIVIFNQMSIDFEVAEEN